MTLLRSKKIMFSVPLCVLLTSTQAHTVTRAFIFTIGTTALFSPPISFAWQSRALRRCTTTKTLSHPQKLQRLNLMAFYPVFDSDLRAIAENLPELQHFQASPSRLHWLIGYCSPVAITNFFRPKS